MWGGYIRGSARARGRGFGAWGAGIFDNQRLENELALSLRVRFHAVGDGMYRRVGFVYTTIIRRVCPVIVFGASFLPLTGGPPFPFFRACFC
jgi:hypothetical protein